MGSMRRFFDARGFLEVSTPVWLPANAPEENIDAVPAGSGWLRTSPELAMKRLLAAGLPAIYQAGPCFRAGERGRFHRPEFALLEWYRAPATSADILDDAGVIWQTAELGKVDAGGGGTVAAYIAKHNVETVDIGVPVISMHAPYEMISKADLYTTHEAFVAFLK